MAECEDAVLRRMKKMQEASDKLQCLDELVARLSTSRDEIIQSPNLHISSSGKPVVEKIATVPLSRHKEGADDF